MDIPDRDYGGGGGGNPAEPSMPGGGGGGGGMDAIAQLLQQSQTAGETITPEAQIGGGLEAAKQMMIQANAMAQQFPFLGEDSAALMAVLRSVTMKLQQAQSQAASSGVGASPSYGM